MTSSSPLRIKVQIYCGDEIAMGPGKADLLDAIHQHGSISAAGRALGISYRRSWLLVDAMNRCWRDRLVDTTPGRGRSGGAQVTQAGEAVLAAYRATQAAASGVALEAATPMIADMLRDAPQPAKTDL